MPSARRLSVAVLLLAAAPAPAGVINGYDPASQTSHDTYDRFASGFPTAPVPNSSSLFLGSGVDLSGVGWRTDNPTFAVTLISPQHLLTEVHVGIGSQVSFLGGDGVVHTYAVDQTNNKPVAINTHYTDATGTHTVRSDLLLVTLTAPIPAADKVRFFPIAGLSEAQTPGVPVLAYGQNPAYSTSPHLGTNTAAQVALASFGDPSTETTRVVTYNYTGLRPGEFYLIGGDSGGPLFTRDGNDFALLGTHYGHSGTDTPRPGVDFSASTFLPSYVDDLNAAMAPTGFQVTLAPVPEPTAVLAVGGLVIGVGMVRRRRSSGANRVSLGNPVSPPLRGENRQTPSTPTKHPPAFPGSAAVPAALAHTLGGLWLSPVCPLLAIAYAAGTAALPGKPYRHVATTGGSLSGSVSDSGRFGSTSRST